MIEYRPISKSATKGGLATSRPALTPPLKWHCPGGKHYLAPKIVALMPPRCKNPNAPDPSDPGWLHYVEPYFGGGAVLLANDPNGISEVVNDIHGELINFWTCLQQEYAFRLFLKHAQATPFSEQLWKEAGHYPDHWPRWRKAAAFFVRCRQSLAGRMDGFASTTRNRTRYGMNEQVSAWLSTVDGLMDVHARLRRVLILNREALDVIRKHDGQRTLFYLDPPYLHETRATTGEYQHEMSEGNHAALLNVLESIEGRFLLSGYRSDLYDVAALRNGWKRHEFDLPNNSAGGKSKRRMTECVWTNF